MAQSSISYLDAITIFRGKRSSFSNKHYCLKLRLRVCNEGNFLKVFRMFSSPLSVISVHLKNISPKFSSFLGPVEVQAEPFDERKPFQGFHNVINSCVSYFGTSFNQIIFSLDKGDYLSKFNVNFSKDLNHFKCLSR